MQKRHWLILLGIIFFCTARSQSSWVKIKSRLLFDQSSYKSFHASTIVELKPGIFAVACFAGTHEGNRDVNIIYGIIHSQGNVQASVAATGVINDSTRFPCWNPVLFEMNRRLYLFYKVGPNPREWWGEYKTSEDYGKTWSDRTRLPQAVLGPVRNKPLLLTDGRLLCPSSVELASGRWKVQMEIADPSLKNWVVIPVDNASAYDVIQPTIIREDGRLMILCRSKQGQVIQSASNDNGTTWSPLLPGSLPNPNSGIDAVTLRDGRHLVVYNPDQPGKEWYNGRSRLRVAISMNGTDWKDVYELENGTNEEYSYPAIIQAADGSVHITYTYNRKDIKYVVLMESDNQSRLP